MRIGPHDYHPSRLPSFLFKSSAYRMRSLTIALSVFGVIFLAELPDKTALAAFVLATRHRAMAVFVGAAAALAIQSLVAVLAGHLISLLPARDVRIGAGVLFIVTAVLMWRHKQEEPQVADANARPMGFWRTVWLAFGVLFLAEWGDLTQLATAALAARYAAPIVVFLGATAALWSVVGIAAFSGSHAGRLLAPKATQRIAAGLFAAVGVALLAGVV